VITFRDVNFTYPEAAVPVLKNVSFEFPKGSFTLVTGESGIGKSTLLRCINGLVPHFSGGTISGSIRVAGIDPIVEGPQKMSRVVGFVFQDPESQFVLEKVEDEVAFALENAAYTREEMRKSVDEILRYLGIFSLKDRYLHTLSGGESQKVAIASALVLHPQVLVLDEPTSQLDPQSAQEILDVVVRLKEELGLTIVLAEHRLERILPYVDQMVYLAEKFPKPIWGEPRDVLQKMEDVPPIVSVGLCMGWSPLPLSVEEARDFVQGTLGKLTRNKPETKPQNTEDNLPINAQQLQVAYNGKVVLDNVSFTLNAGEITCLIGPNGAGKTTLLKTLVGLVRPKRGAVLLQGEETGRKSTVEICKKVGYLPQDPNALLFAETVREELYITIRNHQLMTAWGEERVENTIDGLLESLGLKDKDDQYPRDMSVGERQRVALGAITVTKPGILLLDEPTRGLDYRAKQILGELLVGWKEDGLAILLVTHDVEFVTLIADRLIYLEHGKIVLDGEPATVLSAVNGFKPQMLRLFPDLGLLTAKDVCDFLGKSL